MCILLNVLHLVVLENIVWVPADDFRSQAISFPPERFYSLYSWGLAYYIKWTGHCLEKPGGEGIRVPSLGNLFFNAQQRKRCGESWEQAWQEGCKHGGEKLNQSSNVKGSPVRYITASRGQEPSVWWPLSSSLLSSVLACSLKADGRPQASLQEESAFPSNLNKSYWVGCWGE